MSEFLWSLSSKLSKPGSYADEQPLRAEIYSVERLEEYARALASEQQTVIEKGRAELLPRLQDNGRKLVASYRTLVGAIRNGRPISPAAEWLVDNFHIVEEQLREIRHDLPKAYYQELPKLATGELRRYPRIYALALALIAHTDSRLDTTTLRRFISAYQAISPLSIGELWAVAITLRLALVENLRRLAITIVRAREERDLADKLADQLLELVSTNPQAAVAFITARFEKRQSFTQPFVVQLVQRLREQDPGLTPTMDWIEKQIGSQNGSIEQVIHAEHQRQAAAQVTVGNIITSMRLLSTLDWQEFFESVSLIEPLLGQDPANAYAQMEFKSRDRYRHSIERISKGTSVSELEIANAALVLAKEALKTDGAASATTHVGFYLVDNGVAQLENRFGYRARPVERFRRFVEAHATASYLGTLTFLTLLIILFLITTMRLEGASWRMLTGMFFLALIPASDLALTVLNWDITHFLRARLLPRMETANGLPDWAHTMVVVPTIFFNETQFRELAERLEIHFLANQDPRIYFALLTDFPDADSESTPNDESLLEMARSYIAQLNKRHPSDQHERFYLFHRRRVWNPQEGKWMGWERKRGKLEELNRLLRNNGETTFIIHPSDTSFLQQIRYVITLDSDTQLPRDCARKLIGAAIHPLNRPKLDPELNRTTSGYGILQPRVSVSLPSASRSKFVQIFSGNTGIDPYTTAVSDVYQDLFCEGNFTGKGLYDVDAFQTTLENRIPENTLLSHDLFESLFVRAALTTDTELIDDYPATYDVYAKRQHRWTRGDWQIVRWLFPTVPDGNGHKVRNTLPLISRWRILDNLRRSLVAPSLLIWLIAACVLFPGSPLIWCVFVLLVIAFPVYLHITTGLLIHPREVPWTSHFWSVWGDTSNTIRQILLLFVLLPHQAWLMCDAIIRALYRQFISRKKLLEWMSVAQAEQERRHELQSFLRFMLPSELLVVLALALTAIQRPSSLPVMGIFGLIWLSSPIVAYLVSKPQIIERRALSSSDIQLARAVARRTWRFFETFVTSEDNWLPPDNFQEDPKPIIAHRTSPTNIGLLVLATTTARDLGYLGILEYIERQELTFSSISKLERLHGHFFNWYNTQTLEPLMPQYISMVDSGNLAGHLIALKQACIELPEEPLFNQHTLSGLIDAIEAISVEASHIGRARQKTQAVTVRQLQDEISTCRQLALRQEHADLTSTFEGLNKLSRSASDIEDIVNALSHEHGDVSFVELRWWAVALRNQVRSLLRDAEALVGWAPLMPQVESVVVGASVDKNAWEILIGRLRAIPSLADLPELCDEALVHVAAIKQDASVGSAEIFAKLTASLEQSAQNASGLLSRLSKLARTSAQIFEETDFGFLFDNERKLFSIGYNSSAGRLDESYYDLLASEARLGSFVAIAKGDVPQEHWFRLGRPLTKIGSNLALISWTGSMFEYLMPLLVMRDYRGTLLNETYRTIVRRQIQYGEERGVPWGVSEAAFSSRDLNLTYQYGPFGVPGLGLKRGLIEDLVIAPYATLLASEIDRRAVNNLRRLELAGALGPYGYYESLDYTPERVPQGQTHIIIKAFMAHHQGMSLLALSNLIQDDRMERRFHSDPLVQATELLLQERIPVGATAAHPRAEEVLTGRVEQAPPGSTIRVYESFAFSTPRTQLLSNGFYSLMLTTAGGGYSICGQNAITRWREDVTRDNWGMFIYLRDVRSGAVWSTTHQPVQRKPQSFKAGFAEHKAEFWRTDDGMTTHMEVVVSAEDNAEIRRVSLTNNSTRAREIELSSYSEIVLTSPQADEAHPAFSNLFIETEVLPTLNALLAHRRQRSQEEPAIWAVHVVVAEGDVVGAVQYETDRGRFLGRGHTTANPLAVMEDRPLSNTTGAVLDPVFSLRRRLRIRPGETACCSFAMAVAQSKEEAIALADKYHDPHIFERQVRLAWTKAQVEMSHLKIEPEEAHIFQRLAARIIYSDPSLRPASHVLALNQRSQSGLWGYGISGDLPIMVLRISKVADLPTMRKIVRGHEYLHYKGLKIDLVILNDNPTSYSESLQSELETIIRTSGLQGLENKPGGLYLRRSDQIPEEDRLLLHAVARAVIVTERGSLEDQIERRRAEEPLPPAFLARAPLQRYPEIPVTPPDLLFFNGLGGFHQGGREYVTLLGPDQWTPAPWSNVMGNPRDFGFQVTETGGGCTWSTNSRENRLTPWSNDAISDQPGEIIYMRDEETGAVWSPTPLPIRESEPYQIRHGQGYSVFEHTSNGISQELLLFVPLDAPVKVFLLRLRNHDAKRRRISVTFYCDLVLGVQRSTSAPYIITEIDAEAASIYARNSFNQDFSKTSTFVATTATLHSATCDRKEFLGRNGSYDKPAAMGRISLGGKDGAGLDPCAALQTMIELAPHEAREVTFLLGNTESKERAEALAKEFRQSTRVNEAFEQVLSFWDELLSTIEIKTPDSAFDTMLNRWLLYQTLSCRIWARSAFYQSGGAFGFRDQLQDAMALVYSKPEIARAQLLRASAHQFKEGDVQHWWHPPFNRGVRTRISDDRLWLPFVASFYVTVTGDSSILDEMVPFLEQPLLAPEQQDAYMQPTVSTELASVFNHCVRAINLSLEMGAHGLPLMGAGDWNDGMNRVGQLGKGESVWVGWFLYSTLMAFAPICDQRNEKQLARRFRAQLEKLRTALNDNAWDGDWYRRAYFDDGTPLGSAQNDECRIDSIAQSWSVISRAGEPHRSSRAMAAVEEYLIRRGDGLVILFTPPFNKSTLDPGYIKGYVPGVRENGGQYTHAAIWTLIAFAMLGDGERAGELFSLLNPVSHSSTRAGLHKYKVEAYVAAADVYAVPPHTGRGGWTWYTGSAGWMYRAGLESILGFNLQGNRLRINPSIPRWWREFEINYRRAKGVVYRVKVENPLGISHGVASVELDGELQPAQEVILKDDQQSHVIRVVMGESRYGEVGETNHQIQSSTIKKG